MRPKWWQMIDHNETLHLIDLAQQGDENAKNKLIEENAPLVKCVIKHYKLKGIEYEDLYQLGCVGFAKAINKFDPKFNVKFSTYAVPMILGEVKRHLRDEGYIKVSRTTKKQATDIKRFIQNYITSHSVSPPLDIIAKEFQMEVQDVVFALDSTKLPISIFESLDDDENLSLNDKLTNDSDNIDSTIDKIMLKKLISNLPPRERKIIILRYFQDRTQTEIAEELGVSQVQVSRIESKVLKEFKSLF